MRSNYPKPKPYAVLGMTGSDWNYPPRERPIPTREQFEAYLTKEGSEPVDYDEWRSKVEAAKLANPIGNPKPKKGTAPVADPDPVPPAPTPAAPTPAPAAPAIVAPVLPHRQARPEPVRMEVMSVRVREGISARLNLYSVHHRASKQDVVSDVLDAFLREQGF